MSERTLKRMPPISPAVARELRYYVYLYVDPRDRSVLYVGKGKNGRALSHLRAGEKKALTQAIRRIRQEGREPEIEVLVHGLENEADALKVEAAAIDLLGLPKLANDVRGHGVDFGRQELKELVARYTRKKAAIREPSILIRINRGYRYGMPAVELYDATRSAWRVGAAAEKARYALAIFHGVVREVYQISQWLDAGATFNTRHEGRSHRRPGRREFVGTLAEESVRKRYINKYVGHLFARGAQNPIAYVNTGAPRTRRGR